jgi:hypothetical protein
MLALTPALSPEERVGVAGVAELMVAVRLQSPSWGAFLMERIRD